MFTVIHGDRRSALRGAVLALAAGGIVGPAMAATTTYRIEIQRRSADAEAPTFSGRGRLAFETTADDFSVDDPSEISQFALDVTTLGSFGEDDAPVSFTFSYDLGDVVGAGGIEPSSDPRGFIQLAGKGSAGGEVSLDGLFLDLSADTASGFCFSSAETAQCIRGGGTSTGIEADQFQVLLAPIPVPATLPLALTALGGLALWRRRAG